MMFIRRFYLAISFKEKTVTFHDLIQLIYSIELQHQQGTGHLVHVHLSELTADFNEAFGIKLNKKGLIVLDCLFCEDGSLILLLYRVWYKIALNLIFCISYNCVLSDHVQLCDVSDGMN